LTWQQNYAPAGGSLLWSSLVAALPVAALLYAIGIRRVAAWKASLLGLVAAAVVALLAYRMPPLLVIDSALYGAAFGAFPIFWVVYWAILLYRLTVDTGKFAILKSSIGQLTTDRNLQALLIAFAFGAFLEGAAGFGTPVAVGAAILAGLGFPAFYAAGICLLANTSPVAFGSIGIPLVTLAATTGLPIEQLSADVGRLCAPVSLIIPAYLVLVMGGRSALRAIWPAALVCGVAFAGMQFVISNYVGPYLTDILGSLTAIAALLALLRIWNPAGMVRAETQFAMRDIVGAWSPYLLLILFILLWSLDSVKSVLNHGTLNLLWPGLHNLVRQVPPAVNTARPYAALYRMRLLGESGTACALAAIAAAALLRVNPRRFVRLALESAHQLRFSFISITAVLALAFVMNYSGATATLGLAFAATGRAFPFFSAMLGWLGVFLTGSDTSANALFGSLQQVTANRLGLDPALMASANSAGGVMGKMISLQSISVAAAAAGLQAEDEPKLFRFTLKHSVFLASVIGVLALIYAYASLR
jgi:L-lactate transport